jgi:hypothetical protein
MGRGIKCVEVAEEVGGERGSEVLVERDAVVGEAKPEVAVVVVEAAQEGGVLAEAVAVVEEGFAG